MVHVNAMVVWLLFGFIGSVYWLLEDESARRWSAWGSEI
jgi:nitric oxide reductase subunit B